MEEDWDWKERLQDVLAREAELRNLKITLNREQFDAWIQKLTSVNDFPEAFMADLYELYLSKVSQAAQTMLFKLNRN